MSDISATVLLTQIVSLLVGVSGLAGIIIKATQDNKGRKMEELKQKIEIIKMQISTIGNKPRNAALQRELDGLRKELEDLKARLAAFSQKPRKSTYLLPISIIFFLSGTITFLFAGPFKLAIVATPTSTPTDTPTLTSSPTSTLAFTPTLTDTPTFTSTPVCPYRGTTDNETIVSLINAEAAAANQKSMQIMLSIFDPNANFTDYAKNPPQKWVGPVARYKNDAFKQYEYKDIVHIDIAPVGLGISGSTAWYVSGSTGFYRLVGSADWTAMNNGSKVSKTPPATKYGSEHWILQKNDLGCWVIRQMDFDAGHVPFP